MYQVYVDGILTLSYEKEEDAQLAYSQFTSIGHSVVIIKTKEEEDNGFDD